MPYKRITSDQLPKGLRFDVPKQNQGQAIEIAYGGFSRGEHSDGDPYRRVTDRSIGPAAVTYYKMVP
jgi:hypothetical protein